MMLRRGASQEVGADRPPGWTTPWRGPRVLVEHVDDGVREELTTGLLDREYDVIGCAGPRDASSRGASPARRRSCPLVEGQACPAVDDADAIVTGLLDTETGRQIAKEAQRQRPNALLILEGTPLMVRQVRPGLTASAVWPLTADAVAACLPPVRRTSEPPHGSSTQGLASPSGRCEDPAGVDPTPSSTQR